MSGEEREIFGKIIKCCLAAAFVCFLDQLSKVYIIQFFRQGDTVPIIKNVFHFTLLYNTGAAFGILKSHPEVFVLISLVSIIFIGIVLTYGPGNRGLMENTALCFILGGASGNLIDRMRLGYVIDFIDFRVWPVFNIADSFITIGAVMLIFAIAKKHLGGRVIQR
ncbi:MAG: signal peptidase II [Candidatus Omnitrophota bacterium]